MVTRLNPAQCLRLIGLLVAAALLPLTARADVIETIEAAPGTNLSDVVVGETIQFDTLLSSSDPGEHFTAGLDPHIFWSTFDMQLQHEFIAQFSTDLSVSPVIVAWQFLAVAPSTQEVFNGWSDCFPSVSSSGCADTNLGVFRPADSNHITFDILAKPVSEPGTLALLLAGLLSVGMFGRRFGARHFTL